MQVRRAVLSFLLAVALNLQTSLQAKDRHSSQYGAGLIVNIPAPVADVTQAVADVVENTVIRGTKEYNKDEYVSGAASAASTPAFPAWNGQGKVFYKVREQALDPRNFKESGSVGTLAVRYVVLPQGESNTVLRIDAVFEDELRRSVHQSNGTVESSEYKEIQDHIDAIESQKKQAAPAEAEKEKPAQPAPGEGIDEAKLKSPLPPADSTSRGVQTEAALTPAASAAPTSSPGPDDSLEQQVASLRRQVERLVKNPGAPLKSAPFHTAGTLKSLAPGTEVLVVILTPYWFGVETRDGQHGWVERDQLESLP